MKQIVIIGASGHGKVIADIAVRNGYEKIVFLDDDKEIKECAGYPVVGCTCDAICFDADKIIAIGNSDVRAKFQEKFETISLVHPDAVISRRVTIGEGTVIMAGAVINSDVVIGDGCIINTCSSVDHDCVIEPYSHVSIGAHIAGACKIGRKTWVGAGATVSNNITICDNCIIGAGAVVVHDIKSPGVYVGVPAKKR